MNKRLCLLLVLAMTGVVFAASDEATERRVDSEGYEILGSTTPAGGVAVAATLAEPGQIERAAATAGPLAELRARHMAEFQSLADASRASLGSPELEAQLADLKLRHAREELGLLRSEAEGKGDTAYAARLDEALRNLVPAPAPVATTFVPRDPATGAALNAAEGSAK
jgi:hypothetical protein